MLILDSEVGFTRFEDKRAQVHNCISIWMGSNDNAMSRSSPDLRSVDLRWPYSGAQYSRWTSSHQSDPFCISAKAMAYVGG